MVVVGGGGGKGGGVGGTNETDLKASPEEPQGP